MKTTSLIRSSLVGVACMSFLLSSAARAADGKSGPIVHRHTPPVILVEVTGSRIPQRVVLYGQQVNSGSPLYVFQGPELTRGGATTVAGILSMDPSITIVRGH